MPMTKERRAVIAGFLKFMVNQPSQPYYDFMSELLADSAYWRAAVKDHECIDVFENDSTCQWCYVVADALGPPIEHKPDCPWLKAQED